MRRSFAGALCAFGLAALPVAAQQACAERDQLTDHLSRGYGEEFAGGGIQSETRLLEVWYSPEVGTWTVLMTHADGTSCIVASGTHWRAAVPVGKTGVPG